MHLSSKDPEIQTILNWIADKRIDLEPDFQRGEVWNMAKKQLLIDTILREWQMPPIFIILDEASLIKNVLDGHQRLTTIYQFWTNEFPINGYLQPINDSISALNGMYFRNLPERERRKFLDFSIRVFEITNHQRDEPFELFYRLNEGVKLTAAERRNTFYGELRGQVKQVVEFWEEIELNVEKLGFANARLAYHDVVARTIIHLEKGSLSRKLTDQEITERYRRQRGANKFIVDSVRYVSVGLNHALDNCRYLNLPSKYRKFSKPTLFTLIYFLANLHQQYNFTIEQEPIEKLLSLIFDLNYRSVNSSEQTYSNRKFSLLHELYGYYRYRSSTSVNDARALIIRDYFINFAWDYLGLMEEPKLRELIHQIASEYMDDHIGEDALFAILQKWKWGSK